MLIVELEEILRRLETGELSLSRLEKEIGNANLAALARRLFLERKYNIGLSAIASTIIDFEDIYGKNIENPIGAVQVPVGVVGPLLIHGEYAKGEFYVPLATTEGALVASVNRGVKALTSSGGVKTRIVEDGMTRAPVVWTPSVEEAINLVNWINDHIEELRHIVGKHTRHGSLIGLFPYIVGNLVWLRFRYHTGDAMGMNIATIVSEEICKYLEENYIGEIDCISVSGNFCSDKKPAVVNAILGRGKYVVAEAVVRKDIVENYLKAEVEEIHELNIVKNLLGSAIAGSHSYNAHVANIIAAIFLATGQDLAQVVESSLAYTWTEVWNNNLYISVTLPSLEIGTIGGGTSLPTQREALSLLGVAGGGDPPGTNALKFAEIIAATVLAGELNILAAQAAGHLARGHMLYGRRGIKRDDRTSRM